LITPELLAAIYQCSPARATQWAPFLQDTAEKYEINTPLRVAHFLAQVGHESGRLRYVAELASGRAYNGRVDLGNMKPDAILIAKQHSSSPGEWWKGHGLIQITGYDNHRACGIDLGIDLLNMPRLLENNKFAALSAGWFWTKVKNLNALADIDALERITKRVNGGRNGIEDRRAILVKAKEVLGI
jgi:putative chitinase